jgi:hypothetical protein
MAPKEPLPAFHEFDTDRPRLRPKPATFDGVGPMSREKFAKAINKSLSTIKRYEVAGVVVARRDAAGGIYYLPEDVLAFLNPSKQ